MNGTSLASRWQSVKEVISTAAKTSGRSENDITTVVVSKKKSAALIKEAFGLGLNHFGENYLQEALPKQEELKELNIHWHFVGALQSKKIKNNNLILILTMVMVT